MILSNLIIFKLIFLLFSIEVSAKVTFTRKVNTTSGLFRGLVLKTVVGQIKYSSFRGIRYAKPPVDDLRFKPSIPPVVNFSIVHNAIKDPNVCPQYDVDNGIVIGNEDCLFLNVYTPETKLPIKIKPDRAVMVWIHGGAFLWGSINSSYYGPDFLLEKDVVVVAMNYRLGALGFLKNDPEIAGNMGLKDQVLALEWVRDNIAVFGGNPKKVTIFGESAGAVAVELHRLSLLSRGLFRASIAMSGSPLNPWAYNRPVAANAISKTMIGLWSDYLGIDENDNLTFSMMKMIYEQIRATLQDMLEDKPSSKKVHRELNKHSVKKIVKTTHQLTFTELGLPFVPTTDNSSPKPFLTESPNELLSKQNFTNVPHIIGYTLEEMIGIKPLFYPLYSNVHWMLLDATEAVSTEYAFHQGIEKTIDYIRKNPNAKVWNYCNSFDYPQSLHKIDGIHEDGCGHVDDIAHIFYVQGKNQPLDPQSDIGKHREKMVTMWTNFAKYLNPTPDDSTVHWPHINEGNCYLSIDKSFECLDIDEGYLDAFF